MKTLKRALAGFLAVLMLMSTVNLTAFAEAARPEQQELSQQAAPEQPAPDGEKAAEPETAEEPEPGEDPEEPEGEALPAGDETAEPPVYKVVFRLTVAAAAEGEEAPESAVTEFTRELAAGAAVTEPTAEELAILALPEDSVLDGWYLDPGYSQPADFAALKAEKDLVLYARAAAEEAPAEPAPEAAPIAEDYGIMPIFSWSPILTTTYEPVKDVYEVGDTIHVTFHVKNDRGTSMQHIMLGVSGSIDTSRMKYESSTRSYEEGEPYTWEEYTGNWGVGWQFNYEGQWEDWRLKGLRDGETLTLTFSYEITENDINDSFSIVTKAANGLGDNDRNEQTLNTKVKKGTLTVAITGNSDTKVYDGTNQKVEGYTFTVTDQNGRVLESNVTNDTSTYVTVENTGKAIASGTDAKTYPMNLTADQFKVKQVKEAYANAYYAGSVKIAQDGQLTITPKPITVTVKAAGPVHEDDGPFAVELDKQPDGLVNGHVATLTGATGTVDTSSAGEDKTITGVTGTLTITDGAGKNVTNNYEVTYTGTADVLPATHTVTYEVTGDTPQKKETPPEPETVAWNIPFTVDTAYGETVETDLDLYGNPTVRWTFDGWYLGGGKVETTTITADDENITLTGKWTKATISKEEYTGKVTVAYSYDGKKGEAPDGALKELSGVYGSTVTLDLTVYKEVEKDGVRYVLDGGPTFSATVPSDGTEAVIEVRYYTDANKDNKPDKDQTVVITVAGKEVKKTYNGEEQFALEYTVTMSVEGSETKIWENGEAALAGLKELGIELTVDETAKASGKNAGTYDMKLTADTVKAIGESFYDVQVTSSGGKLIIKKAELTVTAEDASKTFGDPDPEKFEYKIDGLQGSDEKETIAVEAGITVTRKDAGNNTAGEHKGVLEPKGQLELTNYTVTYVSGDFTINKKGFDSENPNGLTVTAPADVTYNGQSQAQLPTVMDNGTTLTKDVDYTLSYSENTKDVGTVTVTVEFTGNYSGTAKATYDITRATLTVTTGSASKTYDGTPLTKRDGATITGLVNGETATVLGTGAITNKGSVKNGFYIYWYTAKSENYTIHEVLGTLTIDPAKVTVTANDASKVYGEPDPEPFTATVNGLVGDDTINYTVDRAPGEDVTKDGYAYAITPTGDEIQGNYTVEYKPGKFTIEPKEITNLDDPDSPVQVGDLKDKVYKGESWEKEQKPVVTVNGETLKEGTDYELSSSGDTTNVTEKGVTVTVTLTGNYSGTTTRTYQITPYTLHLYGVVERVYDGSTQGAYYNNDLHLLEDDSQFLEEHGQFLENCYISGKDVGEYGINDLSKWYVSGVDEAIGDYVDLTGNYVLAAAAGGESEIATVALLEDETVEGPLLIITPAKLTITADDAEKTFGENDPDFTFTYKAEGAEEANQLLGEDTWKDVFEEFTVTRRNSGTEAAAEYTDVLVPSGTLKAPFNYTVTYEPGDFTINVKVVNLTDSDSSISVSELNDVTYNGLNQAQLPTVTDGGTALVLGEDYTLTYTGNTTNVGTVTVTANFTGNYEGSVTWSYQILPAPATVTVNPAAKVYGAADPALTAAVTGLVNNEPATLIDYTLARAAGENVGAYAITATGDAVQGNYTVTYVPANLTINPAQVFVLADDAEKTEGEDDPVLTATVMGMVNNEPAGLINYNLIRTEGEDVGEYDIIAFGAEAQGNYTVTYVPATLTINPALAVINEDDTPLGNGPDGYTLTENNTVDISEDGTPLAGSPVENCCVLHLLLILGALAVELFYTHDRKKRQQEEFQVRRSLT